MYRRAGREHGRRLKAGRADGVVVLLCACALFLLWGLTLQRIDFERGQAEAAAMRANANLAIAVEHQVSRTLKAAEQVAAFVREAYLREGEGFDLQAWARGGVIREALFNIVSVVDARGEVVTSTASAPALNAVNYADRAFFQVQRGSNRDHLYVNQPVFGRVSGRWQVPMSLRISAPDGAFMGVVVMSVDPLAFTDFHRQADLGPQGLLTLTGLDGVVRASRSGVEVAFGQDVREQAWFRRALVQDAGSFIDEGQGGDGVRRILSFRRMPDQPLVVAVGTAHGADLAPVQQRRSTYLALSVLATLGLVVGAALVMAGLRRQRAATAALQSSEELFRATFDEAAMGMAQISPDGRILRANETFCQMLGYSQEELFERRLWTLSEEAWQGDARAFVLACAAGSAGRRSEIEKPYRRRDGSRTWVCETLGVVHERGGKVAFLVAVAQDITARKDLEARLAHAALHDPLTGLPNRVLFMERFVQMLESARRNRRLTAVFYIDLDGFKAVNDRRGHAAGDALLQQVARRLEGCLRAEDTVARFGGDEFAVALAALGRAQDCEAVAAKILEALAAPFPIGGVDARISASVGGALFPTHGESADALVAHADMAMYVAKNAGKNRFAWGPSAQA